MSALFAYLTEVDPEIQTDLLLDVLRTNAVFLSIGVAFAGVIVAITVFLVNTRIARRMATIEAWRDWTRHTSGPRMRIGQAFPAMRMSKEDAIKIRTVTPAVSRWRRRESANRTHLQQCRRDISEILNGLARIAVGAKVGVLDKHLLKRIAGTRIPAAYVRFEEYIVLAREGQPTRFAQPAAYADLTELVRWMVGGDEQLDSLRRTRSVSESTS